MGTTRTLDSVMTDEHVIRIHADGSISEPDDVYPPEVWADYDDSGESMIGEPQLSQGGTAGEGWVLLDGWSGQYGYSGPLMHPSEYVGGHLEDWIRETPGLYVVLVVAGPDGECADVGWVIAHRDAGYTEAVER